MDTLLKILLKVVEILHIPFILIARFFEWIDIKLDRLEWNIYKRTIWTDEMESEFNKMLDEERNN